MIENDSIKAGDRVKFKNSGAVGWGKIKVTSLFNNRLGHEYAHLEIISDSGVVGLRLTAQPIWKLEKVNA